MKEFFIDILKILVIVNVIALGCAGFIDVMDIVFDTTRDTHVYLKFVVIANFILVFIGVLFFLIVALFPSAFEDKKENKDIE